MSEEELKSRIAQLEQELHHCNEHAQTLGSLLEKKLNETYTLYHISKTIGSLLNVRDMLEQVTKIIRKTVPFDRVSVYLLDESTQKLELTYQNGLNIQTPVILSIGDGVPGRIVEIGEHSHIHDMAMFYETFNDFIHVPGEEKRDGSYIGVSLKAHDTMVGVIGMDNAVKYGLSVDDMDLMAVISHQISSGIEKARLFGRIQQLSQLDGLTGLYNRRVFQERLTLEVNRRSRTQKPVSLIMLDIDHFKRFNDNYGHQEGDEILKELAGILKKQCRFSTIDACCRFGGEEFVIILPELDAPVAAKTAERIRHAVESHPFRIKMKNPGITLTVSVGVADLDANAESSPDEFLRRADDALYHSKRSGRNRVSCAP